MPRAFLSILGMLVATLVIGCSLGNGSTCVNDMSPPLRDPWQLTSSSAPRAVAALIPGLNNNQRAMDELASALVARGIHVYRVALAGHSEESCWPKLDYRAQWRDDVLRAAREIKTRYPMLPLLQVSYSTGSIVALSAQREERLFDGSILFAPAIAPSLRSSFIRALTPLGSVGIALPSLADRRYRAHASTSLRAYRGVFELVDELADAPREAAWRESSALVLMSPADELLDFEKTRRFVTERNIPWRIEPLSPDSTDGSRKHFILTAASLGEAEWTRMLALIDAYLAVAIRVE